MLKSSMGLTPFLGQDLAARTTPQCSITYSYINLQKKRCEKFHSAFRPTILFSSQIPLFLGYALFQQLDSPQAPASRLLLFD